MPTGVSPRRGIAVTSSNAGETAVGFFAYGGQTNSAIIAFGSLGLKAPIFLGGPFVDVPQSLAFSGSTLLGLESTSTDIEIASNSSFGQSWTITQKVSEALGQIDASSLGFDARNQSNGVALLSPAAYKDGLKGVFLSNDSGASWNSLNGLSTSGLSNITSTYIPVGFGSRKYEFAVSGLGSKGYETYIYTPGQISSPTTSLNPPALGSDPQGDIAVVSNILGQIPTISWFHPGSAKFTAPVKMAGVQGAVETISFKNSDSGVAISSQNGNLIGYSTSDGGLSWNRSGALASLPTGG